MGMGIRGWGWGVQRRDGGRAWDVRMRGRVGQGRASLGGGLRGQPDGASGSQVGLRASGGEQWGAMEGVKPVVSPPGFILKSSL